MSEKILSALGLEPIEEAEFTENLPAEVTVSDAVIEQTQHTEAQKEVIADIEYAQNNIKTTLEKAMEAYDNLINVAKQSETARDFEVAAGMLKSIVDANKDFVSISEKKKYAKEELPPSETKEGGNNVTNNNLFVTTTEILKMLKGS